MLYVLTNYKSAVVHACKLIKLKKGWVGSVKIKVEKSIYVGS